MNRWRSKLDANLPGDLRQIAEWINRAEEVLARGINFNPLELQPEESFQRFNRLSEEHAVRERIKPLPKECCVFFSVDDFYG